LADAFSAYSREWADVAVISFVIVANALIGYLQERKAENTIAKLRRILSQQAKVIREGSEQKIPARILVPGDIIVLEAGDKVPADGRIMSSKNLRINQAALTGESLPAGKREATVAEKTALIDRVNMVYSSTLVISGQAVAIVTGTGLASEIGKITNEVAQVKERPENLEAQVSRVAKYFLVLTVVFLAVLLAVGLGRDFSVVEMTKVAISLLVSIVPEGLPVAITVTLSVGLLRVFRRQALIRKLSAAETLGSSTVVCVDKTGTITEGKLMVEVIYSAGQEYRVDGEGYQLTGHFYQDDKTVAINKKPAARLLLELASLVTSTAVTPKDLQNDIAKQLTDPTETAIAVVAAKAGHFAFELEKDKPEIVELPFDQDLRYSASAHRYGPRTRLIAKGSPERIIALSGKYLSNSGAVKNIGKETAASLEETADQYAAQGYRVVALGYTDLPASASIDTGSVKNLVFVGLFAMTDPIRPDVVKSLEVAAEAGFRVLMITGDHLKTAQAIANRAGITRFGSVIHATDLPKSRLDDVAVISRATPSQKLQIVERLQRHGQIVAMTGDGVNDAPALKRADIGIAMGRGGTDVAIEASDMVLLQDSFSSIVEAIKQGRLIWENLQKIIFFLLSTSFAEIAIILLGLLMGLPLPLLAVQILWMNLVTDGVNSMALTVEPEEANLMKRPPRDPKEPLLTPATVWRMLILTAVMTAGSIWVYQHYLPLGLDYARTATLTTVVLFQLFNLLNSRSETQSIFTIPASGNKLMLVTLPISLGLQLAAVYSPTLSQYLGTTAISGATLFVTVAVSASIIVVDEIRKLIVSAVIAWAKKQA
jgi:Ca2+-transporting ATPase